MNITDFEVITREEILAARQYHVGNLEKPTCLILHGAGQASKKSVHPFAQSLQKRGIGSLSFDFSGQGQSSNKILSSIDKKIQEAEQMLGYMDPARPVILIGYSMAGQIAINLIEKYYHRIGHTLLFCPAIYDQKSFEAPFDERFTRIIRVPESRRHHNCKKALAMYTGRLDIIIGQDDEVIPYEVPEIIIEHASICAHKNIYRIPGVPHKIANWMNEDQTHMKQILQYIEILNAKYSK